MNEVLNTVAAGLSIVPMQAYCLPQDAMNALDTGKFWAGIIAAAFAVISLIMIGMGVWANSNSGHGSDGGVLLKRLMGFIFGAVLVSAAAAIAAIFVHVPTDCIPLQ